MEKKECVTKQTMLDFYKGKNRKYKNCIGDTLENFLASAKF